MAIDEAKANDILQGRETSGESGNAEGETKSNAGQPEVYELNGKKYTPENFKEAMTDYQEHIKMTQAQRDELGELRKKVETKPTTETVTETQTTVTEDISPEQDEYNRKILFEKYGVMTKKDFDKAQYDRDKVDSAKQVAAKLGVKVEDVINEVDELNQQTKGQLPTDKIEKIWAVNHPDEYLAFRQKQKDADRPDTHYTERSVREGIELPPPSVPSFGKNVEQQALELINQKGVE